FMTEILRPGLVFLRRPAFLAAEQCQCLPEAVRIEVREARRRECLLEDGPDRTGATPVLAVQSCRRKPEIFADGDRCRRGQGIVQSPELVRPQVSHPIDNHRPSSPTGKKVVTNDFENLVCTSRAS